MTIIGTKWVFKNKLDENGVVSQDKARLVTQGYNQQEGIDYDETHAPVARLESVRILLAYACALDFKLFQMDEKSAFMNGFINEEEGFSRDAKSKYNTRLAQLLPRHIYSPCIVNYDVLNQMGCDGEIDDMLRIWLREAGSDEEILTSMAWIRAFNINEPIYVELCHKFYSTYEFDERTTGYDKIQKNDLWLLRIIWMHPRMGRIKIRQEVIEHMEIGSHTTGTRIME
nr:copia protein [Tanacetum cinerariifolium]